MAYIDCFVAPVPKKNLAAYRRFAKASAKVWKEHGALDYAEWVGDDVPPGKVTSFDKSVKLKEGEVVIFGYAVYASRKVRDQVMKKVMSDPRMPMDPKKFPFDGRRMFFGGFKEFVQG